MDSRTVGVACPECGKPAVLSMYTLTGDRMTFEFACADGHEVPEERAQQLWVAEHRE